MAEFDFEGVFDPEHYCYFYAEHLDAERSREETAFLASILDLGADDRVLDVPCGHGRIANRLAERGPTVHGLDRSRGFLERAREDAADRDGTVRYACGDMRRLPHPDDTFTAAYNVFTSFGYFDDAGNRRVLDELARVLEPGGVLAIETLNRDGVVADFSGSHVGERDGDYVIDRAEFDPLDGRTHTRRVYVRDGETTETEFSVRVYTPTELADLLESAGFEVVEAYAGLDDEPLSHESPRQCLVAKLASPRMIG